MTSHIAVERKGYISTVTLSRAEKGNALSGEMLSELEAIACSFADDEQTRAVILRAEGDNFSYGMDLDDVTRSERPSLLLLRRQAELGARLIRAIGEIHQPTVCAVQGVATGGGACIASACDFRVAADNARIGYGEVKLGMNLMWQALPLCVHLVGPARAKQLIMSGKLFTADTLAQWGFLDEICAQDELDARTLAWAEEYAALPPMAAQMIKRSINRVAGAMDVAIMHADVDQWLLCVQSEDFDEAISAFKDRRGGEFTGN
ncbi:MAG: enoyl-CoA hydratase/isomerase family protein [Haliea sp.]|uniref:enoyl-CoA hydratase/isomerase family protein n=1 Tax=Haliea sp. TaxID=1932666 RepID=UPI0032EC7D38